MYLERITGFFDVAQHGGYDQDRQPNPEENEEASEIPVVAVRIEMGDSWGIVDGMEWTVLCLRLCLFLCGRE